MCRVRFVGLAGRYRGLVIPLCAILLLEEDVGYVYNVM